MKTLAKGICLSLLVACMMLGCLILTSTQVEAAQPNFNGTIFFPEGRVNTHTRLGGAVDGWFDGSTGDPRIISANHWHNGQDFFLVEYRLFSGGNKRAFARRSDILIGGQAPRAAITRQDTSVFRQSNMRSQFGTVWGGQRARDRGANYMFVVGSRGNNVQVIFRLDAGGHRMGWIQNSALDNNANSSFNPIWPTSGGRITQGDFNSRGQRHSSRHARAIDIAVPSGTAVFATEAGTVTAVRNLGNASFGRYIEIRHDNGAMSLYAHLSRQDVQVGQRVTRGQRIGLSGNTGNSTGPHLHFELSNSTRDRMADFFPGR